MLTKTEKISFVDARKKLVGKYKVIGIVQLKGVPDRLLQSTKNALRQNTKFIMGRKTLLKRILESNADTKKLVEGLTDTSAIILSNDDPFELHSKFSSNSLRLAAKPGQIAPDDVSIKAGETGIQPGQTVTDLKSAGIDVQIQKGKVVIAKDKVIVKKGEVIGTGMAKGLHTLDILPFMAIIEPSVLLSDGILFNKKALSINAQFLTRELAACFGRALSLSLEANIINNYTINNFIAKAYNNALNLGLEAKLPDSGIVDLLLAGAAAQAAALNSKMGGAAEN